MKCYKRKQSYCRCKKWNTEISYAEFDHIYGNDCDKVERIITDIENKWEL